MRHWTQRGGVALARETIMVWGAGYLELDDD